MDILTPEITAPKKSAMLGIRLEEDVLRHLEKVAEDRGMKPSGAARLMIKHCLSRMLPKSKARKSA